MVEDSETHLVKTDYGEVVHVTRHAQTPSVLIVCEHASNRMPAGLNGLGVSADVLRSHVAWDPGALGVAETLSQQLSGVLVSGNVSRLVYDCNRPPEAVSAIPTQSEIHAIPGNAGLSDAAREERVAQVYAPFTDAVSQAIKHHSETLSLMVTVHSFTPVYRGETRAVELGLLHGRDDRFCNSMMAMRPSEPSYVTRLNEPYSAADGVAHTLDLHGAQNDLLNVMIEIRNDLIQSVDQQQSMALHLAGWIAATLESTNDEAAL